MSTHTKLVNIVARLFAPPLSHSLPIVTTPQNHRVEGNVASAVTRSHHPAMPGPVVIDMPTPVKPIDTAALSNYLRIGRTYHPLCRHAFIEKQITGYYHYEQRVIYKTCAVAAAYAGAFGPQSIERPDFSYSMALWRLSQKVGYNLNTLIVHGPTGRRQPVAEEMMQLVDENHWTREGLVEWLESLDL